MVEEKHEGAEYRVKRLVWFIVILLVIFFFADKVFPAVLKSRLLLKLEMCKIIPPPPPPPKEKTCKKRFPAATSICESSLIKVYWDLQIWSTERF